MGNSSLKPHFETASKTGVLNLAKNKINEFPPGMKQLVIVLRILDLSDNKFTELPKEIGLYVHLKSLTLNRNRLVCLPDELANLTKLETLSAVGNRLTTIPSSFSQLSNLKKLNLSENSITEFPIMLCEFKNLDVLDLSRNKLTEIPLEVRDLCVSELNLNQNQISSLSPGVADCPQLRTLRMEENCLQLSGIPVQLLSNSRISLLSLDGNLFEMKRFMDLEGYDKYMERYTAVKKKLL